MDGQNVIVEWVARMGMLALSAGLVFAAPADKSAEKGSTTAIAGAIPGFHPVAPVAAGQWTMPAGDYGNIRFSPLDKLDTRNVQNLRVVATMSTGIPYGHEGQPLVVNNTLYMVTPFPNNLMAFDLTQPGFPLKWIFRPNPDIRAVGVACCDVVNRGASFADGKIIYNTLDAHTVAVDANRGPESLGDPGWRGQPGRDHHHGRSGSEERSAGGR